MNDEQQEEMLSIYVLPTESMQPPRALLFKTPADQEEPTLGPPEGAFEGAIVTWSRDLGAWMTQEGVPVPEPVSNAITDHAKSLGVETFLE